MASKTLKQICCVFLAGLFLGACTEESVDASEPNYSENADATKYPEGAENAKLVLGSANRPASTISFSVVKPDPATQVMVYDPTNGLFCWSKVFKAGSDVFLKGRPINVTLPLYCEDGKQGKVQVAGSGQTYNTSVVISGGPSFTETTKF